MRIIVPAMFTFLVVSIPGLIMGDSTGSDADFEGAETVLPEKDVKTLDNTEYIDNYADYSEFQEGQDAEELAAEKFFQTGRMLGIGLDLGVSGFTQGFSEMNYLAARFGIRGTYFFSLCFAMEASLHYQKHPWILYDTPDSINSFDGTNTLITVGLFAKYYLETRHWSDFISWINPHFSLGLESMTITTDAPYGPGERSTPPYAYYINERIWILAGGMGFEVQLASTTYFGLNGKFHYGSYPDEGNYDFGYTFAGDLWTFDASIIFYF